MKKLKVTDKTQCKACLECVRACSEAFYKQFDQDLSCIQIVAGKDGEPVPAVCIQCGKCAKACTHGAITQNAKGVWMIDQKLCQHCGDCVKACPFHVMPQTAQPAKVTKCIACGICAKACPMQILEVVEQ